MKKIKIYLIIITTILYSCEDFLVEEPTSFYGESTLYKSAELAKVGVTGVYDEFQSMFRTDGINTYWGDYGVDYGGPLFGYTMSRGEIGLYALSSSNVDIYNLWEDAYSAINVANSTLESLESMNNNLFDPNSFTKESLLAEVRFLRASMYFAMVKSWGNIPLRTQATRGRSLEMKQATPTEIYKFIIEDLEYAEEILPVKLGGGQATKGAAAALLGKVYLQMTGFPINDDSKFSEAANQFKKVIDMGIYELIPNYADVFDYENEDNKEVIMPVKFETGGIGEGNRFYWDMIVNTDFLTQWDSLDMRFAHTWGKFWNNLPEGTPSLEIQMSGPSTGWHPYNKFYFFNKNYRDGDHPTDHPLIRYADVLLGYSEALNGMNATPPDEAYLYINMVRERARNGLDHGNRTNVLPDYVTGSLTKEEFMEAILQERSWEFVNEGSRKDDLIRTDRIQSVLMDVNVSDGNGGLIYRPAESFDYAKHRLWPIPLIDLNLNSKLAQNPEY